MYGHEHNGVGVGVEIVEVGDEGYAVEIFHKARLVRLLLVLQHRGGQLLDVFKAVLALLALGGQRRDVAALFKQLGQNEVWRLFGNRVDYGLHELCEFNELVGRSGKRFKLVGAACRLEHTYSECVGNVGKFSERSGADSSFGLVYNAAETQIVVGIGRKVEICKGVLDFLSVVKLCAADNAIGNGRTHKGAFQVV